MPQAMSKTVFARLELHVVDFETLAPPESPSVGDAYIVARGATGTWSQWDDDCAVYSETGWARSRPVVGSRVFKPSTGAWQEFDGSGWRSSETLGVARGGITASATQAQGQVPLGHGLNQITTVATASDACTLPPALAGLECTVANDAAVNTMNLFPASGDKINGGSVDAAVTLAAGKRLILLALDGTTWISVLGA